MSKEDIITAEGKVLEVLPGAKFKIQLDDTEHTILAYLTGKMLKKRIRVLLGDSVTVELSPYDMTKGRIIYRKK
ncbi:MAG: translation initiation factor IF-1 [Alphaproteobacteria bacterium]|nr:MAG: translation initiation factor IF-1 [Alphaproteobacteria bacterium]